MLDDTDCKVLLDRVASKSFIMKAFYLNSPTLHTLPMFASRTKNILVGNGQCVGVLFVIPVVIDLHGHKIEVYTLVSEIHDT